MVIAIREKVSFAFSSYYWSKLGKILNFVSHKGLLSIAAETTMFI